MASSSNASVKATVQKLSSSSVSTFADAPGVSVPSYDRSQLTTGWVHIGCGAFHRSHQAIALDTLLEKNFSSHKSWGLTGVNLLPGDVALCDALKAQDGLYSVLERDAAGERLRVVGSILSAIPAARDMQVALDLMTSPEVKLITLTVTEGGYYFDLAAKQFLKDHADIRHDLANPKAPRTALGLLALVLKTRQEKGVAAPTLLSCDNVRENGHVLQSSLVAFCKEFDTELATYVSKEISFPNSMVDRITPRTTDPDRRHIVEAYGVEDAAPVVCETFFQWVIEDKFSAGRPALENVPGVIFTDDVRPYEDMKLRLLNAGHSQCGYLGHLAGNTLIDQVARDVEFRALLNRFWSSEVIPNLVPVPGISFPDYCATLVDRFSNPNLGDQTLRICLDGSAKIPTFVLPSVRAGLKSGTPIALGCLCVAAWIRFCSGVGEKGEQIPIEDPMAAQLRELGSAVKASPHHDPKVFLEGLPVVFGELATTPAFVAEVTKWVSKLYSAGARTTLKEALSA